MTVTVREALPAEHGRLGEIVVAAYRDLGALHGDEDYAAELRDVARRAREAVVLAAIDADSGEPIGCATYVPGPDSPWAEMLETGDAGIRMLAVAPSAQGRGAGTALARACVERALKSGRRRLVLHSLPIMTGAQRIYARLGFRRDESRDWEPVPGINLMGFSLDLDLPAAD